MKTILGVKSVKAWFDLQKEVSVKPRGSLSLSLSLSLESSLIASSLIEPSLIRPSLIELSLSHVVCIANVQEAV